MKYFKDTNNKPFEFEDNVTAEIISNVESIHNTTLTEITETDYEAMITPSDAEVFASTLSSKQSELTQAFDSSVKALTTAMPHEMVSWRKQEDEARAWNTDNTVATPFIDAQLVTRNLGETKQGLVDKIIANADAYSMGYAGLLGKYQNLVNQINVATTVAELEIIKW